MLNIAPSEIKNRSTKNNALNSNSNFGLIITRHVAKLRDLLLSDFLKTLHEIAFRDPKNPKFSGQHAPDPSYGSRAFCVSGNYSQTMLNPPLCPPRKAIVFKIPFAAFLGVVLQNSEDYKKLYKKYTKDNTFLVFEYICIFFIVFLRPNCLAT